MYEHRLQNLGCNKELNKQDQLLHHFVNAQKQSDGKSSIIVFEHGMKEMLKKSSQEYDYQEETLLLQKAANMCVVKNFHQIHGSVSMAHSLNIVYHQTQITNQLDTHRW